MYSIGLRRMGLSVEELRAIVREEVKRALLRAFLELIPYVSEEEQKEIEAQVEPPEDWDDELRINRGP